MNLEQNVKERLALYECLPYGLETVLHTAGELFHNPIILTTAGYKVISLINTTGVENPDPIWQFCSKYGYCSADSIDNFKSTGVTSAVHTASGSTWINFSVGKDIPRLIQRIEAKDKTIAYIGIYQLTSKITEETKFLLDTLCQILSILLQQSPLIYEENDSIKANIIQDLLHQNLREPSILEDRLLSAKWKPLSLFSIIVILFHPSDTSSYFQKYLKRDIMNTLPICTVTEYSGNLIVLLNARKEADFALAYRQLNSILKHNRLQAGAGRYFHTLTALPYHYTLALESATIAQVHNPGEYQLFQYDDDFLSHVLNRIPAQYCDEGLLSRGYSLLRAFDKEHNTEYAHTLETFIEKWGNINQTAEALYVHRNTVRLHLQKIKEIAGDIYAPNFLFDFYLSSKLIRWYNRKI
ncbi:helix-turn-helix domain-containing protein [Faecalicatena acetigenes]|uniref:Helix-turn-helix domain-containing protein n=1 Tax=Faecalicatena acetigenes TaxID=2981790 RepID=A0ABT2TDX6_9FIRM|nr:MULTISPECIES: helix-turn-helix domain-containing protein [Lachnospiraceae]MCU6748490.1 helix-turn-helix domain-containing protein [Faecalicatena acetigenes]SCI47348.1 carbohydrate diacid transcriptional activator CdaR [uncultured Clostridium sp.]